MKLQVKYILRISGFIIIVLTYLYFLNILFTPRNDISSYQFAKAPYYEKPVDVVFVGSSHIACGIDPNLIWKEFGIPSFNHVLYGVDLKNEYFLIKELLDYHTPKIIVMDLGRLYNFEGHAELTHRICDGFHISSNKYHAVMENDSIKTIYNKLEYLFPILTSHKRKLEYRDFHPEYRNSERGHQIIFDHIKEPHIFKDVNDTVKLSSSQEFQVKRILDLIQGKGIKLLLIKTPHLKALTQFQKEWNSVASIAKERGVEFISFNKEENFRNTGLNYDTDMNDDQPYNGHVNQYGSKKLSVFMGRFLKEKYSLKDYRQDKNYSYLDSIDKVYQTELDDINPLYKAPKGISLANNDMLNINEYLMSANRKYHLILQKDGNLVLYNSQKNPLWSSNTSCKPAKKCVMQSDGNLVMYDINNKSVWSSETFKNDQSMLILQDDGNLVIYCKEKPIWSSNTIQQ